MIFNKGEIYEFISQNGTYIPCSSVLFNMDKIRNVGYFETGVLATDELYWTKVLSRYPIAVTGDSVIYRKNHPGQAEWSDFNNKPKEIITAHQHFLRLADYEVRENYKKEIVKIINKKFVRNLVHIAGAVAKYYGNGKLGFWYLGKAMKLDFFQLFCSRAFWKVLLIILLNSLGIYNHFKGVKKKVISAKQGIEKI